MMFTVTTQTTDAHFPRTHGSSLLPSDRLKVVYHKYKTTRKPPPGTMRQNLIFAHGTGFNKLVWKYHIEKLYQQTDGFFLDSVVAIDAVGHGDSGALNQKVLGLVCDWGDNGKDINAVVRHEQNTTGDFVNDEQSRNIAVGHSYGGHGVIMAAFYEPGLYDSIIPIEPVMYGTAESALRYTKMFSKLATLIIDDFDSREEYDAYFTKFSFFKTLHPRVLKDLMDAELLVETRDGEAHYRTKSLNFAQMGCYLGSSMSIPYCMVIQQLLRVPVLHVIGVKAKWNLPESITYFRSQVPRHLLTTLDIPQGEHLLNAERPDDTVKFILEYITKRHAEYATEKALFPETTYAGDRTKIQESQKLLIRAGKIDLVSGFQKLALPKL